MKIKLLFYFLVLCSFIETKAQNQKLEKADKLYENLAFIDAIKTYENVAEKGYMSVELLQKLGDAYYFNSQYIKAHKWYTQLYELKLEIASEYYYRYAQTLKSVGDFTKADLMLAKFNATNPTDVRAEIFEKNKNYLKNIQKNSGRYSIDNASINSDNSDYGSALFGGRLIFASSKKNELSKRTDKWTNQPFTSLYAATVSKDGTLGAAEIFASEINSRYHEATPSFTNDGKTMYFSRSSYINDKTPNKNEKIMSLKLFKAVLLNKKWTNIIELPFNSDSYSTGHPALSTDNKTLYFVSDMPGSIGQSDIYSVSINKDGTYGIPQNMGKEINTEGKETFPFISDNNKLYFSSDGHPGLGGLDVFKIDIEKNTDKTPHNIGIPINGPYDDFAFIIDSNTETGYFSSNREGGKGYDDVYGFRVDKKIEKELFVTGKLTDFIFGMPLEKIKITLFDQEFNFIAESYSNSFGDFSLPVEEGRKYFLRAESAIFQGMETSFTSNREIPNVVYFKMNKKIELIPIGGNLLSAFGLKDIYYDTDKWKILPSSVVDIEKIIDIMKQYPNMIVDIRSYTDSRASSEYNIKLSDQRARAILAYMIKRGIENNRLIAKGYGETELVNKCKDGVDCSEIEHEQNRRSEFILLNIN